LELIFWKIF